MRRIVVRSVVAGSLLALSLTAFAAPRNPGERPLKRIVRALGDLITIPVPRPVPSPKQP